MRVAGSTRTLRAVTVTEPLGRPSIADSARPEA